ncbi:MAG: hypothetical protein V1928_04920 [Parcubacteria group bacterium]
MISKLGYMPDPKRKRIAVIANTHEQLKMYKQIFKNLRESCSFRFVWKPEEALRIMENHHYDIVIIEEIPCETIGPDIMQTRDPSTRFLFISSHGTCALKMSEGDIFSTSEAASIHF